MLDFIADHARAIIGTVFGIATGTILFQVAKMVIYVIGMAEIVAGRAL